MDEELTPSQQSCTPAVVNDLVEMARAAVSRVVGVTPDLSPETLPLLDRYLALIPADASSEVRRLAVSAVGCYFGEVIRRALNGRWVLHGDAPETWRIELRPCPLHFSPVGMTGEVLAGSHSDEYDGGFATARELQAELSEMLSAASPLPEDEYFSLSARINVLQLAADWLIAYELDRASKDAGDDGSATAEPKQYYSRADYARMRSSAHAR